MEDRYISKKDPVTGFEIYAVCDGHGGSETAELLVGVTGIHTFIFSELALIPKDKLTESKVIADLIYTTYTRWDIIHKTDTKSSGSTCNLILLTPDKRVFYSINLGDSRTTLYQKGVCVFQSKDHKPDEEVERIKSCGSFVVAGRVGGVLAISRSFGDWSLRSGNDPSKWAVSSYPDIRHITIPKGQECDVLLASDGLWWEHGPHPVKDIHVNSIVSRTPKTKVAQALVNYALNVAKSRDNITVMFLTIRGGGDTLLVPTEK